MAAAFGDADRAFQYLDSGIPQQQPAAAMGGAMGGLGAMGAMGGEDESYDEGSADVGGQGNV